MSNMCLFGRVEALEPRRYAGSLGLEVGSLDTLFCILYNVWGCPCGGCILLETK